jgi:hypothetical protein
MLDGVSRIETERLSPFHQFDDLDQLLASLDVADVVLAALQPLGEVDLPQAALVALLDQKSPQSLMSLRIERASHPIRLNGTFPYLKNPYGVKTMLRRDDFAGAGRRKHLRLTLPAVKVG